MSAQLEDKHVDIEAIKTNGRFRKNLGDLEELKESIQRLSLLNPPTIASDNTLLCGLRRLEALRQLGWRSVPVRVMDDPTEALRLEAERDENTCRLPHAPSELVSLTAALEAREAAAAKVRQQENARQMVRNREAKRRGETPKSGNSRQHERQQRLSAREKAAQAAGWSAKTYSHAAEICEKASAGDDKAQELLAEMDRTGKVYPAWRKLNGTPPPARPPVKVETDRQREVANAKKNRVGKAVYGLEGMCSGLAEADLRYVVVAASTEELDEWDRLLASAVQTLGALRRDLKTERGVA